MSTQINVTVDSGGLSDKAKQLQTAARQAQLEKERTINLSAKALDERVAAQAAKGLSPDGLPLYGSGFKQPQIERRPAASRNGDLSVLLLLSDDFVDLSRYKNSIVNSGSVLSEIRKYGAKSFYFPGEQGAFQKIIAQVDQPTQISKYPLPIENQDFTIEMWLNYERYPNRTGQGFWPTFVKFPASLFSLDIFEGYFDIWQDGLPVLGENNNGISVPGDFLLHQILIQPGVWTHLAAMRINNAVTLFVNGVPSATTYFFDYSIPADAWEFGSWSLANYEYQGWLDDIRLCHGAKYSVEGFAPPSRAFPRP